MRRRTLALLALPLAAALTLSTSTLSAEGAVNARGASAPARAVTSITGLGNAVRVSWRAAPNATRYRVKWAYAPWDKWPSATRYTGWLSASTRSSTLGLSTDPARDSTMTATPYANPVFARVQTANGSRVGPWSAWKSAWPRVSRPAAGRAIRLGTYNVMLAGRSGWAKRMPRIARNIAAHGLGVVALQETMNTSGAGVAARLTKLTGHTWRVARSGKSEGRILYDARRFSLAARSGDPAAVGPPAPGGLPQELRRGLDPLRPVRLEVGPDREGQQADRCQRSCGDGSAEPGGEQS
jgi:hypothetical protein